jgi:hypothetical protein
MVMRPIEIKEIKYEVDKERRGGVISRLQELYRLFGNSREINLHDKSSKYGISPDVSDFITFWLL